MLHMPINHPLRRVFQFFAGLVGLYVLLFGVAGLIVSAGEPAFSRSDALHAMGLHTNLAFAALSAAVGAVVVAGALVGGRFAHWVNLVGGGVFMVAGVAMLAFMQTDLNLLNYSVATSIASYVIGMAMLLAGMYDRVGSRAEAEAEEKFRHRQSVDHSLHPWSVPEGQPHRPAGTGPDAGHRFA